MLYLNLGINQVFIKFLIFYISLLDADITDYFNYGFNEESWKVYCDKQKYLRTENNAVIFVFLSNL